MHGGQLETGPERDRGRPRAAIFRGGLAKAPRRGVLCAREEDYNKLYTVPPIVPPKAMQAGRRTLAKHRPAGSTAQQAAQPRSAGPDQAGTDQGRHQPSRPASRPPGPGQQSQPAENQRTRTREIQNARASGRTIPRAGARVLPRGCFCLRVRERKIFLGVTLFFHFPQRGRKNERGVKKSGPGACGRKNFKKIFLH